MKKSEMLEVLNDALLDQGFSSGTGPCNHVSILENILNKLENAGMLPPEILIEIPDNDNGCIDEGSVNVYRNEWEPEESSLQADKNKVD